MDKITNAYVDGFIKAAAMPKIPGADALSSFISKFKGTGSPRVGAPSLDSMEGLEAGPDAMPQATTPDSIDSFEGNPGEKLKAILARHSSSLGSKVKTFGQGLGRAALNNKGKIGLGAGAAALGLPAAVGTSLGTVPTTTNILRDPKATVAASEQFKSLPHQALMTLKNHLGLLGGGAALGLGAGALYAHHQENKDKAVQSPESTLIPEQPVA